jgi:glycerol-3-phosphate acyltransferase PlsX
MRLAVDVMGGDHGPEELLQGVKLGLAADPSISRLYVVGPLSVLEPLLISTGCSDPRLEIHPASEVLTMEDKPVQGLRKKKDCSILRAVELVRDGKADAVISSGNTGGIVAAATIRLRTLEGIERPTIACIMPYSMPLCTIFVKCPLPVLPQYKNPLGTEMALKMDSQ